MQIILSIEFDLPWSKKHPTTKLKNTSYTNTKFHIFRPFFFLVFLCISIIAGLYAYINTNEDTAATLTDNVIRPVLGNKNTIALEAIFFNLDDKINQIKYNLSKSSAETPAFADTPISSPSATPTPIEGFTLNTIPPIVKELQQPGEGEWKPLISTDEAVLLAKTSVHPDKDRPYAVVNIVKMNMDKLAINIAAGTKQPGGPEKPGQGIVPQEIQNSNNLIAAFSGGFQQKDGYYGMIVGKTTYLPLKPTLATFVMYADKKPILLKYTNQNLGDNILAIRQNCPLLIENGQIVTSSNAWDMQTWGLTTTNPMYTWRSGLGVTKEGDLVYASGPSLVPETLAKALQAAGAINAMQLDINPVWVRFVLFDSLGKGQYKYQSLEPDMVNGGYEYLHGYQKDFFYVHKK